MGYFYFRIKGKITLSFASPEKENLYIYIYDVITWKKFNKYSEHNYSRTHARSLARSHARMHARTHTHACTRTRALARTQAGQQGGLFLVQQRTRQHRTRQHRRHPPRHAMRRPLQLGRLRRRRQGAIVVSFASCVRWRACVLADAFVRVRVCVRVCACHVLDMCLPCACHVLAMCLLYVHVLAMCLLYVHVFC